VRVALAVPGLDVDALELALLRAGHRVAWRALDTDDVVGQLAETVPDALLVADHPDVANATVIGACDMLGVRSLLVSHGSPLSAAVRRLGVQEHLVVEPGVAIDLAPLEAGPLAAAQRGATENAVPDIPPMPPSKLPSEPSPSWSPSTREADIAVEGLREPRGRLLRQPRGAERIREESDGVTLSSPAAPAPRIIAVWGPAGAPGRTTLAIGLAAELAQRGFAVCLVDADTYGGAVAPALGLLDESPGFAAACRLAGSDTLTQAELDRVAQRVPHGSVLRGTGADLRVLTGIGRPHRWPELSAERVTSVLETCRAWRPIIVVDTGFNLESDEELSSDLLAPRRNAATIASLRAADDVVAVGAADPLGLARFLRTYPDLLDLLLTTRVHVVANRVRSSVLGLDPAGQVRQTLDRFGGLRDAVLIDDDPAAADAALLTARSVVDAAPRSALRAGIARLADALEVSPPSAVPRAGRRLRALLPGRNS
jgi:MinD-like ATPase involved in chromosome partitioning or flagellar assembly